MSQSFLNIVARAAGQQAHTMRKKGDSGRANALLMCVLSFVLMPVPFIGIPMLFYSLFKLGCPSRES